MAAPCYKLMFFVCRYIEYTFGWCCRPSTHPKDLCFQEKKGKKNKTPCMLFFIVDFCLDNGSDNYSSYLVEGLIKGVAISC